jgi:beta-N-acetylhexosaminidase
VKGDSHHVLPCDERDFETLWHADIQPFQALSQEGMAAIMPAHVIYPQVDDQPAGFSSFWLKTILRHKMGFDGVIFSDDLTMEGACGVGGIVERARLSWEAGCDIVLVCNRPDLLDELLAAPVPPPPSHLAEQWARMQGKGNQEDYQAWIQTSEFQEAQKRVERWSSPRDVLHGVRVGEAF